MYSMRGDKTEAIKLRKSGKSYNEIGSMLNVPKSTLSGWLKDANWSSKIKKVLEKRSRGQHVVRLQKLNLIRGKLLASLYERARTEARKEFLQFRLHPLFIAGISVYLGEGDRASRGFVRIANIDPLMIRLFVKFLNEVCGVPKRKIWASILIYPDINAKESKKFWATNSGLSENNFSKSTLIKGRHKTRRTQYGICTVGINSTYLKEKVRVWIDLLPRYLIKGKYYLRA